MANGLTGITSVQRYLVCAKLNDNHVSFFLLSVNCVWFNNKNPLWLSLQCYSIVQRQISTAAVFWFKDTSVLTQGVDLSKLLLSLTQLTYKWKRVMSHLGDYCAFLYHTERYSVAATTVKTVSASINVLFSITVTYHLRLRH